MRLMQGAGASIDRTISLPGPQAFSQLLHPATNCHFRNLRRHIPNMRGDVPLIAEGILHAAAAVAVGLVHRFRK
jgi:hypothetical protein